MKDFFYLDIVNLPIKNKWLIFARNDLQIKISGSYLVLTLLILKQYFIYLQNHCIRLILTYLYLMELYKEKRQKSNLNTLV